MPPLTAVAGDLLIHKGDTIEAAGYSGFESTALAEKLSAAFNSPVGVGDVAVCGMATEYCVRATAIDAVKAGFRVALLTDLIRPMRPVAAVRALAEMAAQGIAEIASEAWLECSASSLGGQEPKTHQDAS